MWFSEYGFERTRPFRALKVWNLLRDFGIEDHRELAADDIAMAVRLAEAVRAQAELELLAHG